MIPNVTTAQTMLFQNNVQVLLVISNLNVIEIIEKAKTLKRNKRWSR